MEVIGQVNKKKNKKTGTPKQIVDQIARCHGPFGYVRIRHLLSLTWASSRRDGEGERQMQRERKRGRKLSAGSSPVRFVEALQPGERERTGGEPVLLPPGVAGVVPRVKGGQLNACEPTYTSSSRASPLDLGLISVKTNLT